MSGASERTHFRFAMRRWWVLAMLGGPLWACGHEADTIPDLSRGAPVKDPGPAPSRLEYPSDALLRGAQGNVTALICLDESGTTPRIRITKDEPKLGEYVKAHVSSWRLEGPPEGMDENRCFERNFRFRITPTDEDLEACDGGALVVLGYEAPRRVRRVSPKYPEVLREEGKEGDVVLLVRLDEDGDVFKTELVSSAHRDFVGPAIEAVRRWQWSPATWRGRPVRSCLPARLSFRLRKPAPP